MKTLCNFVSLPLRSWAVRAGQHLAKTWTTARRRQIIWNLVEKLETLHLVTDKLDCEDICFLVLAGNHSWGSHPFLLYHRPCVTWRGGGAALSRAGEFRYSLYSCTGAGRKSVLERNLWCTRRLALFPKTSFLRIVPLWAGVTAAAVATRANSTCSSRL